MNVFLDVQFPSLSNHESLFGLVAELNRRIGMDQREVEGEAGHVDGELAVWLPEDAELADRTCVM
jgi:hypothetical protein